MDIALTISNREISPAVVNLFQFENGTTTLNFTLDSYMYGEVDLRNYKAYGITSINGQIDMTELVATYDSAKDKLTLSWNVKEFTLRQEGAILYQICFKENANDGEGTGVFYSYKGVMINRESIDPDNKMTADYPTLLKQWLDRINELAGTLEAGIIYIPYGETILESERLSGRLYFQYTNSANTQGRFEDHECNVLEMGDYLPLAGGVLTGILGFKNSGVNIRKMADTGTLLISGGVDQTSSTLKLNGKTSSDKGFALSANDGSTKVDLQGSPNGSLIWGGKNVVRSVNNTSANAAGNVTVDVGVKSINGKTGALSAVDTGCLPLSGGTMSGGIDLNGKSLKAGAIELDGAINFHYEGSTDEYTSKITEESQGKINITAPNGFKVNGKDIVRSVNDIAPDNAGNVYLNSLKAKGTNSYMQLVGADAAASGARINVFGKDYADNPGDFSLIANDGTNSASLIGKPNGELSWKGNPIVTCSDAGTILNKGTTIIRHEKTDSYTQIFGGDTYLNGAYVRLNGKGETSGGGFVVSTGDGSANKSLVGKPDGSLTWDGINMSAIGMPSGTYKDLTLGTSGTSYTAPADGWFYFNKKLGTNGAYLSMRNSTIDFAINQTANAANSPAFFMPVRKGDKVIVTYSATGTTNAFKFLYAEGAKMGVGLA